MDEQQAFVNEICEIAERERVELILIAGDVFDSTNPPAVAEQLFYQALDQLAAGGQRAVVVIAGNHDSPERLKAANPLAARAGISLLGSPKDILPISDTSEGKRARRRATAASSLEIEIPGCPHPVVIAALPYPSEARLNEVLSETLQEETVQQAYTLRIQRIFAELSRHFRRNAINLVMSHLFVRGGRESESERPIQLGGVYAVQPEAFPADAHYVALGHLHRPQAVPHCSSPARYAGSPLAYSFSEAGQTKSVILVEAEPRRRAKVREIPLSSGRPLVRWQACEGLRQVEHWCEEGRDPQAWIDLEIHVTEPLTMDEIQKLRKLRPRFIYIRPIVQKRAHLHEGERRSQLPIDELFRRFYEQQMGTPPDEETVKLFLELVSVSPSEEDAHGESEE